MTVQMVEGMPALYVDGGKRITTHSMLKTFLRCPKQTQYKYAERLKKRKASMRDKPLKRGTWLHELLELYYKGDDWKGRHELLTKRFNLLFDEEKEALGDLPVEVMALMRSYLWHYGANKADPFHGWEVVDTELTLECPWPDSPDGMDVYRCRVDILYRNIFGELRIGDHKSHKSLPDMNFRLLDAASPLYIWCARENGLDVTGFDWNYVRTKVPTKPKLVYVGTKREGLSTAAIDTDYPTYLRAIREYGLDPMKHVEKLRYLKSQRWHPDKVQTSPFFQRHALDKSDDMIARVVAASMRTRDRMHSYDFEDQDSVERVVDRSCTWFCDFGSLCTTELFDGNAELIRRQQFRSGDPLDYYHEIKETSEDVGV